MLREHPNWRVRMPLGLRVAIDDIAVREGRSVAHILRILVREALIARSEPVAAPFSNAADDSAAD